MGLMSTANTAFQKLSTLLAYLLLQIEHLRTQVLAPLPACFFIRQEHC